MQSAPSAGIFRSGMSSSKTLVFAWVVEVIAVVMGLILAIFAGIEGSDGGVITIAIATLPFAGLTVIELTKIPLVGLAFRVKSTFWRLLAFVALLAVTLATFENFVFGFERGFNERIRSVENAEQAVQARRNAQEVAQTRIPQLTARQDEITARLAALREEVAGIREQAQQDITDARNSTGTADYRAERERLEKELVSIDQQRDAAVNRERIRCRNNPETRCNVSAIAGSYQRQRDAVARRIASLVEEQREQEAAANAEVAKARQKRDAELAAKEQERSQLQQELSTVREQLANAQRIVLQGSEAVAQAVQRRDELIERSQLHRLAKVLFGNHDRTTLERTKRLFVVSLAAIVALIGSVIAAMHYAAQQAAGPSRRLLTNAIRGYLARRRRRLPVLRDMREIAKHRHGILRNLRGYLARRRRRLLPVREVVKVVEREVPVDRLKLVFLPLDASEEQIAKARRDARQEAA